MCCYLLGRGTISAADIVTDAIVYPEPLDSWLPEDIKLVGRQTELHMRGRVGKLLRLSCVLPFT